MGKLSKNKGATFERVLVRDIIKVFRLTNKRDCYRTPLSGGHHACRHAADITISETLQPRFPWVVEAKHWRSFHVGNFLTLTAEETKCFAQVLETTRRANADPIVPGLTYRPVLVVKANFAEPYAAFPAEYMTDPVWYAPHVYFYLAGVPWVAITWAYFLELVEGKQL